MRRKGFNEAIKIIGNIDFPHELIGSHPAWKEMEERANKVIHREDGPCYISEKGCTCSPKQEINNEIKGQAVALKEDDGSITHTQTRSIAWELGHGEAVIQVDGKRGGYHLQPRGEMGER